MGRFGELVRARRAELGLPLRVFCEKNEIDPSNWSKIERGRLAPPLGETLERYAKALKVKKGTAEWFEFCDLASAETGRIPPDLAGGEIAAKLPVLFRTLREGSKERSRVMSRETIEEMARKIRDRFAPEKIVLFGSYARGDANDSSDVDFLVVKATTLPKPARSAPIYSLLRDYPVSKDILVYAPRELEDYAALPASVVHRALAEGIVLYEKQG
jgi:predicted nucleotidyltransferase